MDSSLGGLKIYTLPGGVTPVGDVLHRLDLAFLSEAGSEQRVFTCSVNKPLAVDISHEEDTRVWHQKGKFTFRTEVPNIVT